MAETAKPAPLKTPTPDAARALAEAAARRAVRDAAPPGPREHGGVEGPEPTRYGDWERKGIVSDF